MAKPEINIEVIAEYSVRELTDLLVAAEKVWGVSSDNTVLMRRELRRRLTEQIQEKAAGEGINLNCRVPAPSELEAEVEASDEVFLHLPAEIDKTTIDDLSEFVRALYSANGPRRARLALEVLRLATVLLKKNADYGGSVWNEQPFAPEVAPGTSILIRIGDKFERLKTLAAAAGGPHVESESFDDTLFDLAGYCLLYLARPVEEDNAEKGTLGIRKSE